MNKVTNLQEKKKKIELLLTHMNYYGKIITKKNGSSERGLSKEQIASRDNKFKKLQKK